MGREGGKRERDGRGGYGKREGVCGGRPKERTSRGDGKGMYRGKLRGKGIRKGRGALVEKFTTQSALTITLTLTPNDTEMALLTLSLTLTLTQNPRPKGA